MRHMKILGLCLLAVAAVAAATSASAFASEPSIWQCGAAAKSGKTYLGHYSVKNCPESSFHAEGGQKYEFEEWFLGTKTGGTGKKGKAKELKAKGAKHIGANLEIVHIGGLFCTSTAAVGEFNGPKSADKVVATFKGCELLHKPCESEQAGIKEGEIRTFALKAEIGYIDAAEHLVGAAFSAESGTYLAEVHCKEIALRVSGSVIGEAEMGAKSPYNKFSKELTLKFEQAGGRQECNKGHECVLLEGVPGEHKLETEAATWPEKTGWGEQFPSAEEDIVEGKGEELYLKA
jgi:hypothetical protein